MLSESRLIISKKWHLFLKPSGRLFNCSHFEQSSLNSVDKARIVEAC